MRIRSFLANQGRRIVAEGLEQAKHSTAHGASEVVSALNTGSAFVQYGASPAVIAGGEDAPKVEPPHAAEHAAESSHADPANAITAPAELAAIGEKLEGIREELSGVRADMTQAAQDMSNGGWTVPIEPIQEEGHSR